MKRFYFDCETTHLKPSKGGIHQLSGYICIDNEIKETFNYKVRPNPKAIIEDEALKVANVTREQVLAYPPMGEVHNQLIEMLSKYCDKFNSKDKFTLIGYNNASFDNDFLRGFFLQNNDKFFGSWFWSSTIDIMILAMAFLEDDRHLMTDFKLKTVAQYLGIDIDESKLHDAMYDVDLTKGIHDILTTKTK